MYADNLNAQLLTALDRPDLRVVSEVLRIRFDANLDTAFRADPGGEVVLGAACLGTARVCAFHIRHALELSMLLDGAAGIGEGPGVEDLPMLAGLCAARTAALFWHLDGPSSEGVADRPPVCWLDAMAGETMPAASALGLVWSRVRTLQGSGSWQGGQSTGMDDAVPSTVLDRLGSIWELLGPAEALMARGGDQRLAIDPRTGLNHYGCSHRPRPWAITFASSTASSLSERGFGGAEASRRRLAAAALVGRGAAAARVEAQAVREGIAAHYGLAPACDVVLAASGTDCELLALALTLTLAECRGPVSSILTAPEETGTGVPLAAGGKHFADDTSGRQQVGKGTVVAGFRPDTRVLPLAVRNADGSLRTVAKVDTQCLAMVEAERQSGRQVLLHLLDLSKTGLLAPSLACIEDLRARHGEAVHVVVDACQARLDASRVRDYLGRGWMVMITGSKFFTGPPFCGAVLLPPAFASGLAGGGGLPAGLAAYCGKADWPDGLAGALHLPDWVNLGLVLRWHAALAEMQAFGAVPAAQVRDRLTCFLTEVKQAIGQHPQLCLIEVPDPAREPTGSWDELQTILSFLILEPAQRQCGGTVPLSLQRARLLYRWLNADVSRALPGADDTERRLAGLLCHIGQPVPVLHAALGGQPAGALRISAGARLLSGEPSHAGMDVPRRLAREIADVRRVLDKITLLLRHWDALEKSDPEPSYAS